MQTTNLSPETILAAKMLLEAFPHPTIRFFIKVYPHFENSQRMTCRQMADLFGYTPQAAAKHVKVLTERGYLSRPHYRAWELVKSSTIITKE